MHKVQLEITKLKTENGLKEVKKLYSDYQNEYQKLYDQCMEECQKNCQTQELYNNLKQV
jgi:hypothetical protein